MKPTAYIPVGADGYELCHPVLEADFERFIVEVNGVATADSWKPIHVKIVHEDLGARLTKSDSPWLAEHALIFRQRALEALEPLLTRFGELLPLSCDEASLAVFNVRRVDDALDERSSSLMRFSNGQIMMIQRYAFHQEVIRGMDAFKIPNLRASPTFVSQRFIDEWHKAKLQGLEFRGV
jgi:hypothetical protein